MLLFVIIVRRLLRLRKEPLDQQAKWMQPNNRELEHLAFSHFVLVVGNV